jgi:hypothetical protein
MTYNAALWKQSPGLLSLKQILFTYKLFTLKKRVGLQIEMEQKEISWKYKPPSNPFPFSSLSQRHQLLQILLHPTGGPLCICWIPCMCLLLCVLLLFLPCTQMGIQKIFLYNLLFLHNIITFLTLSFQIQLVCFFNMFVKCFWPIFFS